MSELLTVSYTDLVCDITLNRPDKMNALSASLVEELIAAIGEAERRGAAVIALRGQGRNFSAGFDFGGYEELSEGDLLLRFVRLETLLHRLSSSPCLTIGFAHGRNFGAGADLFGACHLRVCTDDASFRMPGLKFGLVLNTRRLATLVGTDAARDILGNSRPFHATEAMALGFVTAIAGQEEWADHLARAIGTAKALPSGSRKLLHDAISTERADEDLARVVRSASESGLKDRIAAYLQPAA